MNLNTTFLHLGKVIGRGEIFKGNLMKCGGYFSMDCHPSPGRGKIFMCHATETGMGCGNSLSYSCIWT